MLLTNGRAGGCPTANGKRRGAAAVEFAVVAPIFFLFLIGILEFGRLMMILGVVTNASRSGARAGAVTVGDYDSIISAVNSTVTRGGVSLGSETPIVKVNGTVVTNNTSFKSAIYPGVTIEVQVNAPYSANKWLPGTSWFIGSSAKLSETAVMRREG
jgi:Flp pilus assembly protein TadG